MDTACLSPAPAPARISRAVASLDVMRLVATLLVVAYHFLFFSWAEPPGNAGIRDVIGWNAAFPAAGAASSLGWIGVEVFFAISGFVIVMSAEGKSARAFVAGRVLRIVPGLAVFSALAALVLVGRGILPPDEAALRLAKALVLFPMGPWLDGAIWSLVAEAVFYAAVLAAIMGRARVSIGTGARVVLALDLAFWAAVLADAGGMATLASGYPARVLLVSTNCFFLVGMFAHEIWRDGATGQRWLALAGAMGCSFAAVWCFAAASMGCRLTGMAPLVPAGAWLGAMLACGGLLALERRRPPGARLRAAARRIGLMTYPLYLFHQISGGWVLRQFHLLGLPPGVAAALAIAVALMVSDLFARRIEPVLQRGLRGVLENAPLLRVA